MTEVKYNPDFEYPVSIEGKEVAEGVFSMSVEDALILAAKLHATATAARAVGEPTR